MSLKRVSAVLENLGCADAYKDKFIEHKLNDLNVEKWMEDPKLADEKLSEVIPETDKRAKFMKTFMMSNTNKENVNEQNMKLPRSDGIKLKPAASREEVVSLATLEAIETYIILISVAEESLRTFGEYFLEETFFRRYAQSAEKKIIQMFKSRCDLADLGQLDGSIDKLRRLIQAKTDNLVYTNLIRKLEAEKALEFDIQLLVDKYVSEVKARLRELEQQDKIATMEDLETINEKAVENVLDEFDTKEPRSSVFNEAKEALRKNMEEVYGTFANRESPMEENVTEVTNDIQDQPTNLKKTDPRNLQIMLRREKLTKAAATREEAETIATYDLLMEVLEESFDTFSEDFLDKEILERFSRASETTAIQISGWTNFSRLNHVRQLIESENENLQYPNTLRKIEARETLDMEVQEIINRYKLDLTCKLKESLAEADDIEKLHDSVQQKHLHEFNMREPRSTLFKKARNVLLNKMKTELEVFKAELLAMEEKMKVGGNIIVRNAVQSYRETMEDVVRTGSNFELAHTVAKNVCLKTVENALKDHTKVFIDQFLLDADSRIQFIHDGLLGEN